MMKAMVFLALCALCAAQDAPLGPATGKFVYKPQDKYLARENTGNFACRVDSVQVSVDVSGDEDKTVVSTEDIEAYLSQTATLEWAHVPQFFFASADGRNDEKILGTPGGDMGEFIQVLDAYTKTTGVVLTAEEVTELLGRYLKIMSRSKFFFETDEKSYRKLAIATGCANLRIAELSDKHKKKDILAAYEQENMAEFIGDPFIKFLALNSEEIGLNKEYISYAIQAFHTIMWQTGVESEKLCYTEVTGRQDPKALVRVKTPGYCVDQGLAPLISSQMCAGQTFVVHPDAVKLYRRELVQLVARPGDNPQDILAEANTLAVSNLQKFWDGYTGLPSFTVTFSHSTVSAPQQDETDQPAEQ